MKTYTDDDELYVLQLRETCTIKQTAELSGLSESTVKRIIYKTRSDKSSDKSSVQVSEQKTVPLEQFQELKNVVDQQAKLLQKLEKHCFPVKEYMDAEEYEVSQKQKIIWGKRP